MESYKEGAERFYDLFGEKDDVEFYVGQTKRDGGKALELGVGTARLAIRLARAGVETWGIDTSRRMLNAAERNIAKEDPKTQARLHVALGDAVDFSLPEKFSLIYFPSCSFDHILDPMDQRAALRNIREHLAPGGHYVFDLYLAEELKADRGWFVQRKTLEDGSMVIRSGYHVTKPEQRLMSLDMWYDHVVDGRVAERYYEGNDVYVHDAKEVRRMLDEAGYEVVGEYGDHHGKPYEERDGMIVFVTRPKK